jgi:8-oxo-dGTP pyrophosphatase MutT (NUDIX family)
VSRQQDFDPTQVAIRPAATVMLVRDHLGPLEVFMMKRTTKAAFASGMYVFPGGAVDDGDDSYEMTAIRECFEEAGVLLARDGSGRTVRFDSEPMKERFEVHRRAVHSGERSMTSVLTDEGLTAQLDELAWVGHWVTPFGENRRFDTRFFVVGMPDEQDPLHDDIETVDSTWVEPADALERARSGELMMMPPTVAMLTFLNQHSTADSALAAARAVGTPPKVLPKVVWSDDGQLRALLMPGDAGYDDIPTR